MNNLTVLLLISLFAFTACIGSNKSKTELVFAEKLNGASSLEAYSQTVHPLLVKNCSSCHGDGGTNAPFFAVSDASKSHNTVLDSGKVNLDNPIKSRIVERPLNEKHNNCGTSCKQLGEQMLDAVERWVILIGTNNSDNSKYKTHQLTYLDAQERMAQTEFGTIVLEAESGDFQGRMQELSHASASGLRYMATEMPPNHPLGSTPRIPEVTGKCSIVTQSDLQETVEGRFRLKERIRHIDQAGYEPYSMQAQGVIIVPHLRDEYIQAVARGDSETDLRKYFLTAGALKDGIYDGNVLTVNMFRVLPDFLKYNEYMSQVVNSTDQFSKDFFAPKYGDSGFEYYTTSNEDLRSKLPDDFRQSMVYNALKDKFRSFFFSGNNPRRVRDVPFYFRKMLDANGFPVKDAQGNDIIYSQNAQVAEQFNAHYFTLTAAQAIASTGGSNPVKRIDSFLHYKIDPDSRSTQDFRWTYSVGSQNYDYNFSQINQGDTYLDLANFFSGPSEGADQRSIFSDNFAETLHPVFKNNCMSCHGDGNAGRPQFASNDSSKSFDAIAGYINFSNPSQSRPVQRMDEGHNCGNNCQALKQKMLEEITKWNNQNNLDITNAQNQAQTGFIALSEKERTPGRSRYTVKVKEAGDYNLWIKTLAPDNTKNNFSIRILDENERPMRTCQTGEACSSSDDFYAGKSEKAIQDIGCANYNADTSLEWSWYTPSKDDLTARLKWTLPEGTYTIEIIELETNAKVDLLALSKNPDFNPYSNLIDEKYISDLKPRVLRYDISHLIGEAGFFEIEIKRNTEESYMFRNPRFVGNSSNIYVKGIKLLVNGQFEVSNSTYTDINRVVGTEGDILTYSPLVALEVQGLSQDQFAFTFENLKVSDQPVSLVEDDGPKPVEGRKCKKLKLFEDSVMPILNKLRLIRKTDNDGYTSYSEDFPSSRANETRMPQVYNCTTCHNENHIYFKMTTYFDDSETLCEQALSRVDFQNFERSLLLRGINGTFNHPKLHFIEDVPLDGSGENLRFRKDANTMTGYASNFIGLRFEVYQSGSGAGQINLNNRSAEDLAYLRKFIGQYKRVEYERYNDPYLAYDGEIITDNDSVSQDPNTGEVTLNSRGQNLYHDVNPQDYLNRKDEFKPGDIFDRDMPVKVKDSCVKVKFVEKDGLIYDPCNNNVDFGTGFETIKARYRQAVINWMSEEKKAQ